MEISKPVFLSAILLSVMGTAAAFPFLTNVYVTNFPLDAEGNLKVSPEAVNYKVVTVAKDLNLSWTGGHGSSSDYECFTADVAGYNEFVIYASFRNWTTMDAEQSFFVDVLFVVDEMKTQPENQIEWITQQIPEGYPCIRPHAKSALYHVRGSQVELYPSASADSPYPAGWVLVDISLYLKN